MKVLDSRLLVQVEKTTSTQKIGGIEIPAGNEGYEKAKVIAVGPDVAEHVKAGDEVYIYVGAGKEFTHEREKYRVVTTNEVIVVL